MAGFRENLQHLRRTRNMSQAQLAMLVGVSRQSVAKWEAETSYPEMDKLVKICDIYGCTIDDLVRGDLTDLASDPAQSVPEGVPATDVCGYEEHMVKRSRKIPAGIAAIVLGFGAGNLVEAVELALGSDLVALGLLTFFVGIAVGLAFLVPARIEHRAFKREHPYVEDFYSRMQKADARKSEARGIVAGVTAFLIALVLPMILTYFSTPLPLSSFFWWLFIAVGAWLVVRFVMMGHRVDVARYNKRAEGKPSEKPKDEPVGEEVRDD